MGRDLFAITKDHKEFPVEIGLSPLKIKGALFVQATITDITERKKTEEKIKRINKDLETLLHVVSHDLMEPLRAIVNFSERVRDNYARNLDTKGKDYLRRIVNGARRMRRLLDDILTLSRVRQLVKPVVEVIDSKDIVKNALEGLELKIKETKANIKISKELPKIQADVTWATQAVYNLIANALKFTKEGCAPEIEIMPCRFMDDFSCEAGIVVRDRGIGISAEYAERIFELFQRAVGREVEGTGAGLAIVHEVAIRHNGRAFARPREGGGTDFFITFGEQSS
jgi:signal transduction histidine kinase